MNNQIFIWPFLSLLFLIGSCSGNRSSTITEETEEKESSEIILSKTRFERENMKINTLQSHMFQETVRANGTVHIPPSGIASVSTYWGGFVRNLKVGEGQYVRRGQTLFQLEHPDFIKMQESFLEMKSRLNYLESDLNRQKKLREENINSTKQFLKAQSDYEVMKAKLESLRRQLEMIHIHPESLQPDRLKSFISIPAPMNGYISSIHITTSQYLSPSTTAIILADHSKINIELQVFEKDIPLVQVGQKLLFSFPDGGGTTYSGSVAAVGKKVLAEERIIPVHGKIDQKWKDISFVPGMYIEGKISVMEKKSAALPAEAIADLEGQAYALAKTYEDEKEIHFEKITIKPGKEDNGWVEILNVSALEGQQFLQSGAFSLIQ